jgi:hypothetical protein
VRTPPYVSPGFGEGCQEDRNNAVLTPGQTVARVPGNLQCELAISTLMQQDVARGATDGKSAKHERPRRETKRLAPSLPPLPDHGDAIRFPQLPFGDSQLPIDPL